MTTPLQRQLRAALLTLLLFCVAPCFAKRPDSADCVASPPEHDNARLFSEAWGTRYDGQRYQAREHTSINAGNAASLELRWVYGLSTDSPRSYPLVTAATIYIGDGGRGLVALDRETGCVRWENPGVEDISTAILPARINGRPALVFAQRRDGVYAADAASGAIIWHNPLPEAPLAMFSGSPLVYEDRVFVPLSSQEIALALNPFFACCTTSGGMAALDVTTGKLQWYRPTIEQAPEVIDKHFFFVEEYGPSGAPVWGAPMLDVDSGLLYFGTGQNYTQPATLTSDAIFALHGETGEVAWVKQFTANDTYNMSCEVSSRHPNCPDPAGPDLDFGAPPLLTRNAAGRELVVAGQKSGDVYALVPATGEIVWHRRLGRGGKLGGVHWGLAANAQRGLVYVPISDVSRDDAGGSTPGLFALDINDGSTRWSRQRQASCPDKSCWTGLSAAITAGPDIVVTGALDGLLEILHGDTGELLWSYSSARKYSATNGIPTSGGVIDAHGPMLADDLLIVSSGYGSFLQEGGNALLVFGLPRKEAP